MASGEPRRAAIEEVVLALEEEAEREGAVEPGERGAGGLDRRTCRAASSRSQSWATASVSVSVSKTAPSASSSARERAEVLDDAVVDDGDAAGLVRVGVALGGRAVGRPAGVADAGLAADRVAGPAGRRAR